LVSCVSIEERIPPIDPLRRIRRLPDQALTELHGTFEVLLLASPLQALHGLRSERIRGTQAFSATNDLVINLTGHTGTFPALGSIPGSPTKNPPQGGGITAIWALFQTIPPVPMGTGGELTWIR
jgi:hypothetical protein